MNGTSRNEEHQNDRDVERNDEEALSDLAPTSEVSIDFTRFPPPMHSSRRQPSNFWTLLLTGSAVTAGGVAGGAYALRNFENTMGWALVFSSTTLAGVYLVARSLQRACFNNFLNPQTSQDLEARRYREILAGHVRPRLEPSPSWTPTISDTESFPPSPAVSNVSSDVLTVERADYRPQSTDLSFRQKQEDRAKKFKKFVAKEWASAPSMLMRQRSNASKDKDEDEDEKDEAQIDDGEGAEIEDEREKRV